MNARNWRPVYLLGLFVLITLACSLPSAPSLPSIDLDRTPPTPTPMGDTLQFFIPSYSISLSEGEAVPGTRLEYVSRSADNGFLVRVDGQELTKRNADSFFWSGVLAPGVFSNYNLRIVTGLGSELQSTGSIDLFVLNPAPVQVESIPENPNYLNFQFLAVDYRVPQGSQVPGTVLTFSGTQEQAGATVAQLTGAPGYNSLALGDSLVWTGQLLDNVYVRYSLRVLSIDEFGLRLTGTADLWMLP